MIGRFVEAEITGRTLEQVFVLPRSALSDGSNLLVVDSDDRLQKVEISILHMENDQVLVNGGISAGERVVASALGVLPGTSGEFIPVTEGDR